MMGGETFVLHKSFKIIRNYFITRFQGIAT
jgi:hypothetical protein